MALIINNNTNLEIGPNEFNKFAATYLKKKKKSQKLQNTATIAQPTGTCSKYRTADTWKGGFAQ
jgi:hypothetical protein